MTESTNTDRYILKGDVFGDEWVFNSFFYLNIVNSGPADAISC